jgi:hypothetical protein
LAFTLLIPLTAAAAGSGAVSPLAHTVAIDKKDCEKKVRLEEDSSVPVDCNNVVVDDNGDDRTWDGNALNAVALLVNAKQVKQINENFILVICQCLLFVVDLLDCIQTNRGVSKK